jgi:hypothetical protein
MNFYKLRYEYFEAGLKYAKRELKDGYFIKDRKFRIHKPNLKGPLNETKKPHFSE